MNRDDITKLAKEAGFGNYAYEAAGIFECFAALVAAAEREKCTGTQEFVTLPREVVGQALEAFAVLLTYNTSSTEYAAGRSARDALRAAFDQPKNHIEQHLGMVPAGWRLVPVGPTQEMAEAGKNAHHEAENKIHEPNAWDAGGFASRAVRAAHVYRAMLAAAPQPKVVEQPQANQPAMTPIAQRKLDSLLAEGYTISGYSVYHERKHQHGFVTGAGLVGWWKPEGVEYPQQRCEQEPDWSDSKTLPSELWKNPLLSLQERLQIADGAVQWNREVAENLRARLCAAQQPQAKQEPVAVIGDVWTLNWVGGDPIATIVKKHGLKIGDKLYTHPQPKRNPLTDEQIDAIADAMPGGLEGFLKGWGWRQFARAVLEATNNIK